MSCTQPCSQFYIKDLQDLFRNQSENPLINLSSQSTSTKRALKYFNMRVTQRLHRYRSMKKQWHEVATSMQLSPDPIQKSNNESKSSDVNDGSNITVIASDPLHSRIQQDLIKLRKTIKQRKSDDTISFRQLSNIRTSIPTTFDNQENRSSNINKKLSLSLPALNKLKPFDQVKISGCQMHSSILPKSDSTDSGMGSTSNSSSTCSQYYKQQQEQKSKRQNNKIFNICQSRVNLSSLHPLPSLPSDTSMLRASSLSKKKANTSSKMTKNERSKQTLPSRLSLLIPSAMNKKQPSFKKQEIRTSHMRRLSTSGDITTRQYTHATSSSSIIPRSMMLKRDASLLPILLQSSSCMGLQTRGNKSEYTLEEEQEENHTHNDDDDDYYRLVDYKQLIKRLPESVITIRLRYGKDDYGILFDQLAHIRERMPDSNTYDEYARTR